jgi:hypothetical protein
MDISVSVRTPPARRRVRLVAFAALALVALSLTSAVGASAYSRHHQPPHHRLPSPPHRPDPLSPDALMANVRQYAALPDHYSGTPNDTIELANIAGQFAADGLQLGQQPYTFPRFEPTRFSLRTDSGPVSPAALAPLLYSGTTSPQGVSGQLFDGAPGYDPAAAGDKIVVSRAPTAAAVSAALTAHARALVVVTPGFADFPKKEDVNARTGTGNFPVLLVGKNRRNAARPGGRRRERDPDPPGPYRDRL